MFCQLFFFFFFFFFLRNNVSSIDVMLTFTTLWIYSADDKLIIFWFFFPQKIDFSISCKFEIGDNLHEMPKSVFWEKLTKKKKNSKCRLLKFLPSMLCVNIAAADCGSMKKFTPRYWLLHTSVLPARTTDNLGHLQNIYLISPQKHILWVLIRIASLRQF